MRDGRMIGTWPTSSPDHRPGHHADGRPRAHRPLPGPPRDPGRGAARGRRADLAHPGLVPRRLVPAAPGRGARASAASWARSAPSSSRPSSACAPSPRARSASTAATRSSARPSTPSAWAWRCSPRIAATRGVVPDALGLRERDPRAHAQVREPARHRGHEARAQRRAARARPAARPDAVAPDAAHEPVGRQPAEGAVRPLAAVRTRDPHPRRAHARHRRGRQVRDLHDHQRARRTGEGHHHDLVGAARADRRIRSHRRHVSRPADRHRGPRATPTRPRSCASRPTSPTTSPRSQSPVSERHEPRPTRPSTPTSAAAGARAGRPATSVGDWVSANAILVVLVGLIVAIALYDPDFISANSVRNILTNSSTRILVALGAGIVLISRGVDLSGGRMVGLAAVVSASMLQIGDVLAAVLSRPAGAAAHPAHPRRRRDHDVPGLHQRRRRRQAPRAAVHRDARA